MASRVQIHASTDAPTDTEPKAKFADYDEGFGSDYDSVRPAIGHEVLLGYMAGASKTPLAEQSLLDVACGAGAFMAKIAPNVKRVAGIDISSAMVAQACKKLPGARIEVANMTKLPFKDNEFDAIAVSQALHFLDKKYDYYELYEAFKEFARVLKPGGVLFISNRLPHQVRFGFWYQDDICPEATNKMSKRVPALATYQSHLTKAGFQLGANSVVVPLHQTLINPRIYLAKGCAGAFDKAYRDGDSFWAMAERTGELADGLAKIRKKIANGSADTWLEEKEDKRKQVGQTTYILARLAE